MSTADEARSAAGAAPSYTEAPNLLDQIVAATRPQTEIEADRAKDYFRQFLDQVVKPGQVVSDDVERSRRFYTEVLGGRLAYSGPGGLTYVALANSWIIINVGGGPTDDKPDVTLEPPADLNRVSSFLNLRVTDMDAVYAEWGGRGARFLTPPKKHPYEIRCYIRDPDGHLIEVGQTTDPAGDWFPDQWPLSKSE